VKILHLIYFRSFLYELIIIDRFLQDNVISVTRLECNAMDIDNDAQIGERVRVERERLRWSQQVLAERSDVSRMMIGSYERGTHKPSVSVLIALAQAGADASFLLTGQRSAAGSLGSANDLIGLGIAELRRSAVVNSEVEAAIRVIREASSDQSEDAVAEQRLLSVFRSATGKKRAAFLSLVDALA
jgi:transcriptional regulator with XRE-family HTH domain